MKTFIYSHHVFPFKIYYIYNRGSIHNNISEKNKIDTTVSTFVLLGADTTHNTCVSMFIACIGYVSCDVKRKIKSYLCLTN
jgi:hypothetical protein